MPWQEAAMGLMSILIILIGVVYRNDQKAYDSYKVERDRLRAEDTARIAALEKQNTEQETRLATLIANAANHGDSMDRLNESITKLDNKVDEFNRTMTQIMAQMAELFRQRGSGGYIRRETPSPIPRTDPKDR